MEKFFIQSVFDRKKNSTKFLIDKNNDLIDTKELLDGLKLVGDF